MYVRAADVRINPGKMQEVIDLHNDSLIPAAKGQKGWQGSYLMTDAANDKILSITLWESEEEMLASETASGYLQEQVAKFESVFAGPPNFSHYELIAQASLNS